MDENIVCFNITGLSIIKAKINHPNNIRLEIILALILQFFALEFKLKLIISLENMVS